MIDFIPVRNYDYQRPVGRSHCLWEFLQSRSAVQQKFLMQFVHQDRIVENVSWLCQKWIDPLEKYLNEKLVVVSGYRCRGVDMIENNELSSLHNTGYAVDFRPPSDYESMLNFFASQPYNELHLFDNFVHLAAKPMWPKREFRDRRGLPLFPLYE